MKIRDELKNLQSSDIYSLMLFALYRLRNVPEYSSLSELIYILDKDSLLKLCEYYGGLTIKIPSIEELESIVYSLILYEYIDVEHMTYDNALKKIGYKTNDLRKIKSDYLKIKDLLNRYDFSGKWNE